MREYTVDELLAAREDRVVLIKKLLKQHNTPLLVMRVNYPGLQKTNKMTLSIIEDMGLLICLILGDKVCYKELRQGAEGPVFYMAVQDDVLALKLSAIEFEEKQALGRCLDLDVYDSLGRSISRQELGYSRRKCYLCEDDAQHCVRARRHSEREVVEFIHDKFRGYKGLMI